MNTTKRFIVITSIFEPTPAVIAFSKLQKWNLIVVGDRKSPPVWDCSGARFLNVSEQEGMSGRLARVLPWNHYCRKMLGYVEAVRLGAEVIVDTDDDNIPKSDWDFPAVDGVFECAKTESGFLNAYSAFTKMPIWPRGFPLNRIKDAGSQYLEKTANEASCKIGVWQGLADGDPDVDAIYRLIDNTPCYFQDRDPLVLQPGTVCPFNSQNTAFVKELFPLLYLPARVTFRFTDILRGLVAQPIMALAGFSLGFTKATVTQERNPHDYLADFTSEIPCYLHPEKVIEIVRRSIHAGSPVSDNLRAAYEALVKHQIVPQAELEILDAWLEDMG